MRVGRNVNGIKGRRSYIRLTNLLARMSKIAEISEERYKKPITLLTADEIHSIFDDMRDGKLKKYKGKQTYKSTHDYIKVFKAFWNWYMKIMRKEKKEIDNIVIDLSGAAQHKPDFVYFTLDSMKQLMDNAKYEYKVLMLFMYDSGIRVTEMLNVRRKDITPVKDTDKLFLNIRQETSKTFGRKIKLMLCSDLMKEYIRRKRFKPDDYLFPVIPKKVNQYLKRLGERVFGENLDALEENTGNKKHITLYDFRHSSCCYCLPRYQSESALKWRFGWKKSELIYYYSEFLGMKDTIQEENMLVDVTKTELEKQLAEEKQRRELLQERLEASQMDMQKQLEQLKSMVLKKASDEIESKT
jgi:integrase